MKWKIIILLISLLIFTKCKKPNPVQPVINQDTIIVDIIETDTNRTVIFKNNLVLSMEYGDKIKIIDTAKATIFSIIFSDVIDNRCLDRPQCIDSIIPIDSYQAIFYIEQNNQITDTLRITSFTNPLMNSVLINNINYYMMIGGLYPIPDQSNPVPPKTSYMVGLTVNRY